MGEKLARRLPRLTESSRREPLTVGGQSGEKLTPREAARIPLGVGVASDGSSLGPRKIAVTADGTRAYVTLENASGVSVIDAVALHGIRRTFGYDDDQFHHLMTSQVYKRGNDPQDRCSAPIIFGKRLSMTT